MAHTIWKGTLGFGLVSMGVELLTADAPETLDLDLLDRRDNARIGYQKINKTTGKVVPTSEIVRGFAVSKTKYVRLTDVDLKAANPKATKLIEIVGFVSEAAIPRIFLAKPYFVSPLKGSEKAYALLREALSHSKQVGLAQIVIHMRQHVAAVYPQENALVVQLLRYAQDLREPKEAGVKAGAMSSRTLPKKELAMAEQLIASMQMDWDPKQFKDTYRDDVMRLVKQRVRKGSGKETPVEAESSDDEPRVLDLMAALKRSLSEQKPGRKAPTPARRKRAGTRKTKRKAA